MKVLIDVDELKAKDLHNAAEMKTPDYEYALQM